MAVFCFDFDFIITSQDVKELRDFLEACLLQLSLNFQVVQNQLIWNGLKNKKKTKNFHWIFY